MKKYRLLHDIAFDIPNTGGSITLKKGTIIEAEAGTDSVLFALPIDGTAEPVNVSIPFEAVEEYNAPKYNWLYLAAAGALVFWFVTRDKKRKPEAIPGY